MPFAPSCFHRPSTLLWLRPTLFAASPNFIRIELQSILLIFCQTVFHDLSGILAKLFAHQQTFSHVPYKSLCKAPAALMPVVPWPVNRCPPQSSYQLLEIGTFNNELPFRHVFGRFTFVQLPCTYLMSLRTPFA